MLVEDATHGSYQGFVLHPKWKAKRQEIIERDGGKCICCRATEDLVVHHKQYHVTPDGKKYMPWCYDNKYLATVCKKCHSKGHSLYKIPTFIINNNL